MPKYTKNDVTGKVFGRLTAVKFIPDDSDYAKWLFRCECGKEKIIMHQHVISGGTSSCGCLYYEAMKLTAKHGEAGYNRTKTYGSWASMMDRCEWKGSEEKYSDYGPKGIRVCERWHEYRNFLEDMGERPSGKTIDRIDNSKGYSKENCRWATGREQALNKKKTCFVLHNGEKFTSFDLCAKYGIKNKTFYSRKFRSNKDVVKAFKYFGLDVELYSPNQQY